MVPSGVMNTQAKVAAALSGRRYSIRCQLDMPLCIHLTWYLDSS